MMREILFRGKRIDTGEWVYGDLVHSVDFGEDGLFDIIQIWAKDADLPVVYPETIGQYTGFTDMNGVNIFTGDIVEIEDDGRKIRREIVFSQGSFQFHRSGGLAPMRYNLKDSNTFNGIIIGNVSDNPELIEVRL